MNYFDGFELISNKINIQEIKFSNSRVLILKQKYLDLLILYLPYELTILFLFVGFVFTNVLIYAMGFIFLVISLFLYSYIPQREFKYSWWEWLQLNRMSIRFELIIVFINIFISIIFFITHTYFPQYYQINLSVQSKSSIMTYFTVASLIGIKLSQKITNHFGAKYVNIFKHSALGIISYSKFAFILLSNKDQKGIKYLIIAIKHLKNVYKKNNNKIVDIEETIQILDNYNKYSNNITYEEFSKLSQDINNYTNIENLLKSLNSFVNNDEYSWTKGIIDTRIKLPPRTQLIGIISIVLTIMIRFSSLVELTNIGNVFQPILTGFTSIIDTEIIILYISIIALLLWFVWIIENNISKQDYDEYMY